MADDSRDRGSGGDPEDEFRDMLREILSGNGEFDPAQLAKAAGLPSDPALVARLIGQLQDALQNETEGIRWGLTLEQATGVASRTSVPSTAGERSSLEQALRVARLWLDEVTDISDLPGDAVLLSRREWVEKSVPVWTQMAEPVALSMASAVAGVLDGHAAEELGTLGIGAGKMMRNVGGTLFAMQLGQVVGQLSTEVVSGGDVGFPILDEPGSPAALVTQNVQDFGRDLGVPVDQVQLYLAVRELAHARLFRHAKWLRQHVMSAITDFSRGIAIDTDRIAELAVDFDPANPEELRTAMTSGAFIMPRTDEQNAAVKRLETMLALIEGWVDTVTARATERLPKAAAIAETVSRRRATGGPAESAFATLVGLELRPRRLREAAAMWRAVTDAAGADQRDALWGHPDLVPSSEEIDDPSLVVVRASSGGEVGDDLDQEIEDLLDRGGETGEG